MSRALPPEPQDTPPEAQKLRLDKWLWAARFFKTRALAAEEIAKGRVQVNGVVAKASRELKIGDELVLRHADHSRTVVVRGLSGVRGPAPVAQALYEETPQSLAAKAAAQQLRRMGVEPADAMENGRPTKRDRRQLVDWQRWSADLKD